MNNSPSLGDRLREGSPALVVIGLLTLPSLVWAFPPYDCPTALHQLAVLVQGLGFVTAMLLTGLSQGLWTGLLSVFALVILLSLIGVGVQRLWHRGRVGKSILALALVFNFFVGILFSPLVLGNLGYLGSC